MNSTARSQHRNVQVTTAKVIPFRFEAREVRTILVDDQPWFAAKDIIGSLGYAKSSSPAKLTEHVPSQWKGVNPIHTPGGMQRLLMLSEQGLYFFLGRSDKEKALPFQIWLAGEVLPEIRRSGRYTDSNNKLATLLDELIGMSELNVIKGLIRDKAKVVSLDKRRSFQQSMHNRLHTRFNVPRIELIPAAQFEAACNFVAAYALEGEWISRKDEPPAPSSSCWESIGVMAASLEEAYAVFEKRRLYAHLDGLGSPAGAELLGLLWDGLGSARHVKRLCAEQLARH